MQVIKMPQTKKPGEEKAKMGFMEYAISGILLHDNIVQTYQADIRPVFLEDDATGQAGNTQGGRSGWTGLGEFLSNEAISAQLQRSMRIQEWELRLVMEYCNRGAPSSVMQYCNCGAPSSRALAPVMPYCNRGVLLPHPLLQRKDVSTKRQCTRHHRPGALLTRGGSCLFKPRLPCGSAAG